MEESNYQTEELEGNIQEGYNNFYFDYYTDAICLKTTSTTGKHKPINTDKLQVPTYEVIRDKIKITDNKKEIFDSLNQYKIIKEMITTKNQNSYMYTEIINLEEIEKIQILIRGEDFIAYLDNDLNIVTDCIQSKNSRTKEELNKAIDILNKKKEEIENERKSRNSR